MIQRLAWRITEACLPDGSKTEREIVAYVLECRISDVAQIVVLILLALATRCMAEITCFSLCFTLLKRQVGGWHLSGHFSCIGVFSALAGAVALLAGMIPAAAVLPLTLAALGIVIRFKPVAHENHPKSQAAHEKSRRAAILITSICAVVLPIIARPVPAWAAAGAIGALLAAASLLPAQKTKGVSS